AIFSVFAGINTAKISLGQLAAGDVVNDVNLDQLTGELVGNLFHGETGGQYVKKHLEKYWKSFSHIVAFNCKNTSIHAGYFPNINVEALKKIGFNNSKLTGNVLGIDDRYVGNDYMCFSFKFCDASVEESVLIELKNPSDYPEDVKRWIEQTGLSGAWRKNETSYVSSIFTGDCVYQILVFEKPESRIGPYNYRKHTPIHIGRISSASHNATLENWTSDLLNRTGQSLG
ncbi:GSCOCG00013635001-RA-CDS, partial [Cotesia congregata]